MEKIALNLILLAIDLEGKTPKWQDKLNIQRVYFVIEPYNRFARQPDEQASLFLLDPRGNALEFKTFRDIGNQLFEKH